MLGKNNYNERLRKIENESKKDRFSIRKLTIGAASVLVGLSFVGLSSQTAKADTVNSDEKTAEISRKADDNLVSGANKNADSSATNTETASASSNVKKNSKDDLSSYKKLNSFLKLLIVMIQIKPKRFSPTPLLQKMIPQIRFKHE